MRHLPIDDVLEDIVQTLKTHRQVVLQAPPGAGKSTRLPPALLDARDLIPDDQKILVLEPRRVAARAVAAAQGELGEGAGEGELIRVALKKAAG